MSLVIGLVLLLGAAHPVAAGNPEPGEQPWLAGASNMGMCSAYLGQLPAQLKPNARAEVNYLIRTLGPVFGLSSLGELYRVRAKQHVNLAPELECLPRPR